MLKRTDDSKLTSWYYEIDRRLLGGALILVVIGMLFMISAGAAVAGRIGKPWYYFIVKAVPFYIIGLITLFSSSMMNKKWIIRLSVLDVIVGLCLLMITIVDPYKIKGSTRFVHLMGYNVMPADIMKPGFIVLTAYFLDKMRQVYGLKMFFSTDAWWLKRFDLKRISWWYFIPVFCFLCAIIVSHPDIGTGALYIAVVGAMLLVAGLPLITLPFIFVGGVSLGVVLYNTFGHFHNRIHTWWTGDGDKFQVQHSLESIKHGGLLGSGDDAFVKQSLPDAHTDFVFAAIAEDVGAIAACVFLCGLLYVLKRLVTDAMRARNPFVFYATVGAAVLFGTQVCINIMSTLYILPPKGMTLPFVSYGGSSFVSYCLLFGIIMALIREDKWK